MLAVGLLVLAACAGVTARNEVLLPAMEVAWVGVKADVEYGIDILVLQGDIEMANDARSALAEFDDVFMTGDRERLPATQWPALADLAAQGIQMRVVIGEIGPGVAESKMERLRMFHDALVEVLR